MLDVGEMAGVSVQFYATIFLVYVVSLVVRGQYPSATAIYSLLAACFFFVACWLGFAPVAAQSLLARALHVPADVAYAINGRRPFNFNLIGDDIVLGRLPRSAADLRALRDKHGVHAVLDMTEAWEDYLTPSQVKSEGLSVLKLPTPDYAAPSLESVERGVAFIEEQLQPSVIPTSSSSSSSASKNGRVFVHCNGGKGRSTTVVVAYLVKANQWTPKQALEYILARRKVTKLNRANGLFPQWRVIQQFAASLKF